MSVLTNYWRSLSPALRRYYRAGVLPSLLFVALTVLHEWATRQPGLAQPLRILFALAPTVALAWMFAVYLRFLRDCDELERRIESGALAWAAGITMLAVMAGVLLLDAGLVDVSAEHAIAWLGVLLFGSYALVRSLLHRRYA